jgi:putative phosphoribosyl transferase
MFQNREHAGKQLGHKLAKFKNKNLIVLGIPRGGVVVAYHVAKALSAELSVIIARKLGYPTNPELGFGAIAEDGSTHYTDIARYVLPEERSEIIKREMEEIKRRQHLLRDIRTSLELSGKTVIIVDDGIATGSTLFAAIKTCKAQKPKKIIVAVPVCSAEMKKRVQQEVDEVVVLETPEQFRAVSLAYWNFPEVSDNEMLKYLRQWHEATA